MDHLDNIGISQCCLNIDCLNESMYLPAVECFDSKLGNDLSGARVKFYDS
jgi:hypothetical protein